MTRQYKNIIALAVVLVPFYFVAILQKIVLTQEQILVEEYLGYYMLFGMTGISTVLLTNKFLLKNTLTVFRDKASSVLIETALAGVILTAFYLFRSVEAISYGNWIHVDASNAATVDLFTKIFDNTLYSMLIIGPFSWINEAFTALSIGFILINLWHFSDRKIWVWCTICITGFIFAIVQINLGIPTMINSFLIVVLSGYIFYKYRSILPILSASIILQTIDLGSFWYYS